MAAHPLSDEMAADAVRRVEEKLREGFRPPSLPGTGGAAITEAARQAVLDGAVKTSKAFASRLVIAGDRGLVPDWSLYQSARHQPLPQILVQLPPAPEPQSLAPSGNPERVLVIGDLHQDPRHPHRVNVMTWIARYASEQRFDRIIQIGDWGMWDSASTHDKPHSLKARLRPSFRDDMENLTTSHRAYRRGMADGYRPKQDFLMGNHEYRLEKFENENPETQGTFTLGRDEIFAQFGWRVRPYGQLHYVEGVAFTHHAINSAGRAFGGETGPQRAANKSTVPVVGGHTHRKQMFDAAKIGPLDVISMVEVGCAMPWGEVEHYIGHGVPTGWWWGVCAMTVQGGLITDLNFVSMLTLRARYSDDGADIAA